MRVLTTEWRDGYLDSAINFERECRIAVKIMMPLRRADHQFVERRKDVRMVLHYLRRVGLSAVMRKIRSRLGERERNAKFASLGVGELMTDVCDRRRKGDMVVFFAYNHPLCAERISLDHRFIVPLREPCTLADAQRIGFIDAIDEVDLPPELEQFVGWSPFSGIPVSASVTAGALAAVAHNLRRSCRTRAISWLPAGEDDVGDRSAPTPRLTARKTSVLFGYGNYAKTVILPNWDSRLPVECVHEIDSVQLRTAEQVGRVLDTSASPRAGERYSAWLIAGYHHTHAPLAVGALEQGAAAVVEKPLCTTMEQLHELRRALSAPAAGRLFTCFQRRYTKMNEWATQDLQVTDGGAIDYHCIVYEIPLPPRHWYLWPNSKTRLTSNGCHWIDHFLYLNGFSEPVEENVWISRKGTAVISAELANGAVFSMVLTDRGSERVGMRDYVELRRADITVKLVDSSHYTAETTRKVLRRGRVNPMKAYRRMYSAISKKILEGEPGDDSVSLRSTELTLRLEDRLKRQGGAS